MKRQLKKPKSKRTENLYKVRIMETRGTVDESCSNQGDKYQGCQNLRGCGCVC